MHDSFTVAAAAAAAQEHNSGFPPNSFVFIPIVTPTESQDKCFLHVIPVADWKIHAAKYAEQERF